MKKQIFRFNFEFLISCKSSTNVAFLANFGEKNDDRKKIWSAGRPSQFHKNLFKTIALKVKRIKNKSSLHVCNSRAFLSSRHNPLHKNFAKIDICPFRFRLLIFLIFATFLAVLPSCKGVIFDEIRNEVALDDADIYGDIGSIVRFELDGVEHSFTSNGNIYYRNISTTKNANGEKVEDVEESAAYSKLGWEYFSKPNGYVYALAADENYLYAAAVVIDEDDDGYNSPTARALYCYDTTSKKWTQIYTMTYSSASSPLFCTNAPQKTHRMAYFRNGSSVWRLSGSTELTDENKMTETKESLADGESLSTFDNTTTPTYATKSCAYFDGDVYFSSSYAMTTNETSSASGDATAIYYSSGDNVYYKRKYTETTTIKTITKTTTTTTTTKETLSGASENSENTENDATSGETEEEPDNEEFATGENETEDADSTAENGEEPAQTIKITKTTVTTKEITTITTTTADGKTTTTEETRTETLEPVVETKEQTEDVEITPEDPVTGENTTEEETTTSEEKQTGWTAVDLSCDTIYSLAVTADYLLAGTDEGIVHTPWDSASVPTAGNANFSTNAASTLSSYYEIWNILVVEPAFNETDGTIFASSESSSSSASLKNVGLWGYYKSKGKWNRE